MAVVAAEVVGLTPDRIQVFLGDTKSGMYSPAGGGSVTLTSILPAVRSAAEGAREKPPRLAAPPPRPQTEGLRPRGREGGRTKTGRGVVRGEGGDVADRSG